MQPSRCQVRHPGHEGGLPPERCLFSRFRGVAARDQQALDDWRWRTREIAALREDGGGFLAKDVGQVGVVRLDL